MDYNNLVRLSALTALGYVAYQVYQVNKQETKPEEVSTRMPEYRNAGHLFDNPVIIQRVYRDGPISWVAEVSSGKKIIAYSAPDGGMPAVFRRHLI